MPTSASSSTPELTPCQVKALDMLQREGNVFLTGAAGTGKSFLLQHYLQGKASADYPVIASTGAAAVIVGGRTFHSFFGLGILEGGPNAAIARALRSRKVVHRLNRARSVIIDEVSMLSGTLLRAAETVARKARGRNEPWGGLRIIAVGDFAQLPPVTRGGESKDWAFLHDVWQESDFQPALLSTVVRTQEPEFLDMLNAVRIGTVSKKVTAFLDARCTDYPPDHCTRIYPHRAQAETYNLHKLAEIDRPEHSFPTTYEGDERTLPMVRRAAPVPETLVLKQSALIMMRRNDMTPEARWVNGSLGIIRSIREDTLDIELMNGEEISVQQEKFTCLGGDGEEIAAAWNFPVTLAWASTIHKAQGASVDAIHVDLSALWESGQAYVALSRTRTAAGLTIHRWDPSSIRVDSDVTRFYDSLTNTMQHYLPRPLFVPPIMEPTSEVPTERIRKPKKNRYAETARLLREHTSIDAIAQHHGIQPDRVTHHIERLLEQKKQLELGYLRDSLKEFALIRSVFEAQQSAHLKPVFDALHGTVPYETIHLVRTIMRWEEGKKE